MSRAKGHGLYSDVPEETYQGLLGVAQKRGVSLRTVLIKAIDQYVAADKRRKNNTREDT